MRRLVKFLPIFVILSSFIASCGPSAKTAAKLTTTTASARPDPAITTATPESDHTQRNAYGFKFLVCPGTSTIHVVVGGERQLASGSLLKLEDFTPRDAPLLYQQLRLSVTLKGSDTMPAVLIRTIVGGKVAADERIILTRLPRRGRLSIPLNGYDYYPAGGATLELTACIDH